MDETRRGDDAGWGNWNVDRNVTRIDERIGYYEKGKGWQRRSAAIVSLRRFPRQFPVHRSSSVADSIS